MAHQVSKEDEAFRDRFESCETPPDEFDHRAHVRLAYVYLCGQDTEVAYRNMRDALYNFLDHHGVNRAKYHDTMTRAWILAIRHFMAKTPDVECADVFIDRNPVLLDTKIMMTHYSAERLFSDEARAGFVEPDLDPIPRHGE